MDLLINALLWLAVVTVPAIALWEDRAYTRRDPMHWEDEEDVE